MGQWWWWGGGGRQALLVISRGPPLRHLLYWGAGMNSMGGHGAPSHVSSHPTPPLNRGGTAICAFCLRRGGIAPRFFSTHPVTSTRAQVASLTEGRNERKKERRKGFSPILPHLPSMKYPVSPASPSGAQWEAVCSWDLLIDSLTMSTQPTVSVHTAQDILIVYVTKRALQQSGRPVGTS